MLHNKIKIKKECMKLLFVLPAIVLFIFVVAIPFFNGIRYSFTNWDGISPSYNYIGLKNYSRFFLDENVIRPILNSLAFTVITVIGNNVLGLLIAIALKKNTFFNKIYRTLIFMPFIISLVLAGFIWTYIYSDVFYALLGVKSLLGNPRTVMFGVSLIGIWRDTGYVMLIYLAALHGIPDVYYEAAKIDGAGVWQTFRSVTLPMIAPAITINISLYIGWGLKVFDYVMAATKGGPGKSSETLALYVYNYTFPYNKAGYGQAAAIIMMLGIFIITAFVTKILRKKEIEM